MNDLISQASQFIKHWEGLRLLAYQDSGGIWTIGYGTTKNVTPGMKINLQEAEFFLQQDLCQVLSQLLKLIKIRLQDHQMIALIDFIYNVGTGAFQRSTLRQKLNRGELSNVPKEFLRWNKVQGKVIKGLTRRREAEAKLFSL